MTFFQMKPFIVSWLGLSLAFAVFSARGDVIPNPLFADNAVLQQGMKVPVWGTAAPGEKIRVEIAGQSFSTTASFGGEWKIEILPMKAGGPHTMTISGRNKIVLTNILVGEVWICGGQSNMEFPLGPQAGEKPITDWQQEAASANYPAIRQFYVPHVKEFAPAKTVNGNWSVCSPKTVTNFTAVGYFFGRDLFKAKHVPIGLIHSSWGGTVAEAWTSEATLSRMPYFADALAQVKLLVANPAQAGEQFQARQEAWYAREDWGLKTNPPWNDPELNVSSWKPMTLPTVWQNAGYPDFHGLFWFRRSFDLPDNWDGSDVELHLGAIDDNDTTWVNGKWAGATAGWDLPRIYQVPGSVLRRTNNVIAVRVLDTGGGGGIWGKGYAMVANYKTAGRTNSILLNGEWLCKQSAPLNDTSPSPVDYSQSPNAPTALYNGMIAPLLPYAIRGVIWYQGEANIGRERQYRTLFPALITDWRSAWGEGDFPFLFVQIAPFTGNTPEIREAQLIALEHTTNTAMAVTIDCGDAQTIHPPHKQPVGARLALAARVLACGEKVEYSGPIFDSMKIKGSEAILSFTHLGGGLVAKEGLLKGFTIAGADKVFHPAHAEIRGNAVVVSADGISVPTAVRYGWANVPEGNLFNRAGLPASPFRTDVD